MKGYIGFNKNEASLLEKVRLSFFVGAAKYKDEEEEGVFTSAYFTKLA